MPAAVMRVRARRREQGIEQHVDVAHGEAFIVSNKVERVVERASDIRQVGFFLELFLVLGHHPEGIDQQNPAAQLAPAPGGDAPELAARINGHGRSLEPPVAGRQQVEGDEGALADAGRGHGDGRAFQGPTDQLGVSARAPLAEQDAPAFGEAAQKPSAEQLRPAVKIGLGPLPPVIAMKVLKAVDNDFEPKNERNREARWRHGDQGQFIAAQGA